MGCKRRFISFLAALVLATSFQAARAEAPQTTPAVDKTKAVVIELTGLIDDYSRDALQRRFAQARQLHAGTVILQMDTPGGLVTAGLDISRFIKNQTDLHTIAFI